MRMTGRVAISIGGMCAALMLAAPAQHASVPPCFDPAEVCAAGDCEAPALAAEAVRVRRLTNVEVAGSLRRLTGLGEIELPQLPDHDPDRLTLPPITPAELAAHGSIADAVSIQVASDAARRCQGDDACLVAEVRRWGEILHRRPLQVVELTDLAAVCHAERVRGGGDVEALARMARLLLQSPAFLYVTERGRSGGDLSQPRVLGDTELAGRLALAWWLEPPDARLLAAAASGMLGMRKWLAGAASFALEGTCAAEVNPTMRCWPRLASRWFSIERVDSVTPTLPESRCGTC